MLLNTRTFIDMLSYFSSFFERQPNVVGTSVTVGRASTQADDYNSRADVNVFKVMYRTYTTNNEALIKTIYISFRFTMPIGNKSSEFSSIEILKPDNSTLVSLAKLKPDATTLPQLSTYFRQVEDKLVEVLNGGN